MAAFYSGSIILCGAEATRERFLAALPQSNLLHFAGHALLNLEKPFASAVVLAPSEANAGILYAHEIAQLRLAPGTSVILAACARPARGRDLSMEGSTSLAWSFLAAGARAAIASNQSVEDLATRRLLLAFHQAFRRGGSPAAALRTAQTAVIESGQPAADWASFSVMGGLGAL